MQVLNAFTHLVKSLVGCTPFSGDFDDPIIPQSPDYVAGFAVYIALGERIGADARAIIILCSITIRRNTE